MQNFFFINKQNLDDKAKDFNNVFENNEYISAQMSLKEFILNEFFRIKTIINLMKLNSQYNFI